MTALLGIYTELTHDRQVDYRMIEDGDVDTVLILQPDWNKVSKIWVKIKDRKNPRIILRSWDWDDGRTKENSAGVYDKLKSYPNESAKEIVERWHMWWANAVTEAHNHNAPFPKLDNVLFHLINEPDTNIAPKQIDTFTSVACREAKLHGMRLLCYNFGTGHPALQVAGPGSDPDWSFFSGSIKDIIDGDHVVGLHEYQNNRPISDSSINPWHIMRHKMNTAKVALKNTEVIISEWGLEMLVNNAGPDHHGFAGIISEQEFASSAIWYCSNVAEYVSRVLIFASDLPDRTWNSFDPTLAYYPIVNAMQQLRNKLESGTGGNEEKGEEKKPEPEASLIWPCDGLLTQRFGVNPKYYEKLGSPGHNGIDIAAPIGTNILAIADGVAEWVDEDSGYGKYIRIWHESLGLHSFYAHLDDQIIYVKQEIRQGQPIAKMGSTGNSTGPHLHFELRFGSRYVYKVVHEGYKKGQANPEAVYATMGLFW